VPSIDKYCRTRQAMLLLIRNSLEAQAERPDRSRWAPEAYLKEFCTVRVAGPRLTGHTSAIHDLREELEHDHKHSTIALTAVSACERKQRTERWPVFTPMRQLDKAALAEIVFVDNAFNMSGATEGRVYAFAQQALDRLGRVVVVLVQ